MRDLRAARTYLLALVPAVAVALTAGGLAVELLDALPGDTTRWLAVLLTLLAPFCAGFLVFGVGALRIRRRGALAAGVAAHLRRAAPPYALALLLAWWLVAAHRSRDFWMVAQLGIWPLMACLGGITADLVCTRSRRPAPPGETAPA